MSRLYDTRSIFSYTPEIVRAVEVTLLSPARPVGWWLALVSIGSRQVAVNRIILYPSFHPIYIIIISPYKRYNK